jgi:anti-anti-sigma regulatory factor
MIEKCFTAAIALAVTRSRPDDGDGIRQSSRRESCGRRKRPTRRRSVGKRFKGVYFMQGITTFSSIQRALRAGFPVYDRMEHGHLVPIRTRRLSVGDCRPHLTDRQHADAMTNTGSVELYSSSLIGLRAQAVAAADETLRRRRNILVIGLDGLSALDDAAVSASIVALRRLREVGGTVRLVTHNANHRKQLAANGLDRIFEVFSSAEEAQGRVAQSRKELRPLRRAFGIATAIAVTILLVVFLLAPISAQYEDAFGIIFPGG